MIQIYADGVLAYDSRLEKYDLESLTVTRGLNVGGTAEFTMPPGHPAYNFFVNHKTVVEIYRQNVLRFRGRALYPTDDFDGTRTITCEGEMCLLRDGISRPYLYEAAPAATFAAVIEAYNAQVESFKQFKVGTIDVTDPNDYVRVESESAETILDTVNKLIERCGGYVVFTTDTEGKRTINWLTSTGAQCNQTVEFGENLLDFVRTGSHTTNLATGIIPYGAKDEETGKRLTIESVNDGLDYLIAEDAQAIRGTIMTTATWDDVTIAANLYTKAWDYLQRLKSIVTSLELSALDLSYLDKTLDIFTVGDTIRVVSKPHGVDEDFQLTQMTEDLLNPAKSRIVLGKDAPSLTSSTVVGDAAIKNSLEHSKVQVKTDVAISNQQSAAELEVMLQSLIDQTETSIKMEIAQTYVRNDDLEARISTQMTQLADQILFEFETLRSTVDENDADHQGKLTEIYNYISFENGDIRLGGSASPITLTLEKDLIVFKKNGQSFGWWDGVDFHTGNIVVEVNERAQFGDFAFVPRSNGSLSFLKVGG